MDFTADHQVRDWEAFQCKQVKEESMNKSIAAIFAMTLSAAAFAPAAIAKDTNPGGTAVLMPAGDIKWTDVAGFQGVQMAALQGNPAKGPHHSLIKLAGGFMAPLHHHSPDHYVSVISGTLVLTVDGKENKLPPGSYFSFTGKKRHITKCEAGSDCILAIDARGKWDVLPEKSAPAAKK
jgi:mannose-6-phosphate isomerase-like protein (cupin superfamily)